MVLHLQPHIVVTNPYFCMFSFYRMEAVMSRIQSSISDLSDAERNLSTELQTRQDEMDNLRMTLDQVHTSNIIHTIHTSNIKVVTFSTTFEANCWHKRPVTSIISLSNSFYSCHILPQASIGSRTLAEVQFRQP